MLPLSSTQAVDQLKVDSNPYRFLLLQIDPALAQYPTPRLRAHQFTAAWPRPFLTAHPGVHEGTSPIRVRAACPPVLCFWSLPTHSGFSSSLSPLILGTHSSTPTITDPTMARLPTTPAVACCPSTLAISSNQFLPQNHQWANTSTDSAEPFDSIGFEPEPAAGGDTKKAQKPQVPLCTA